MISDRGNLLLVSVGFASQNVTDMERPPRLCVFIHGHCAPIKDHSRAVLCLARGLFFDALDSMAVNSNSTKIFPTNLIFLMPFVQLIEMGRWESRSQKQVPSRGIEISIIAS